MKLLRSSLLVFWDLGLALIAFASALFLPLCLLYPPQDKLLGALAFLIPSVFFLGDLVKLYLAEKHKSYKNQLPRKKENPVKYGFEVLSALPLGCFLYLPALDTQHPVFIILCLIPLLKLPAINKLLQKRLGQGINPAIYRLASLVFWVLLAAHLIACAWIGLSEARHLDDPYTEYIRALYWSITTVTTIGYGDITPQTNIQTVFTMFIQLFGAAVFSMVIANLANLVASIDGARTRHKEKLEKVSTFLAYKKIPRPLQRQVFDYFEYLWESRRGFDEQSVLDELPQPLRVNIAMQINQDMIAKVPFFSNAKLDLIREIVLNLMPVVYPPGEDIIKTGELANDMFFISSGSVDILVGPQLEKVATLSDGAFFGEIALLFSTVRTATVRAADYCDLYRLDRSTFERIIKGYPEFHDYIQKMAEERRSQL